MLQFTVTGDYLAQTFIAYQETGGQATVKTWTYVSKKVGNQDPHMSLAP